MYILWLTQNISKFITVKDIVLNPTLLARLHTHMYTHVRAHLLKYTCSHIQKYTPVHGGSTGGD